MNSPGSGPAGESRKRGENVPNNPDQLTPELLTDVLRDVLTPPSAVVTGVRWERVGHDRGFTGLVARLHLDYSPYGAGPQTMIAKFPLAGREDSGYRKAERHRPEPDSRHRHRAFREAWFYDMVAPHLSVRVPRCWATASDPDRQRLVLLLEDIMAAEAGDALRGCASHEVASVLAEIAPMHASWWGRTGELADLPSWSGDRSTHSRRQTRYREQWNELVVRGDLNLPRRVRDLARTLCDCLAEVLDELDTAPQTLIHGDLHLDNLLFSPADQHAAVILDWQGVCRGPAALDTAHFLVPARSSRPRKRPPRRLPENAAQVRSCDRRTRQIRKAVCARPGCPLCGCHRLDDQRRRFRADGP